MIKRKMMFNYPFLGFRNKYYPYKYYNYPIYQNKYNSSNDNFENKPPNKKVEEVTSPTSKNSDTEYSSKNSYFFSILGIRLYFDDLIILALLFFLYNEGVKDDGLFICLILLLLS